MCAVQAVYPGKPFDGYLGCIGLYLVHGSMAVQVAIHRYLTGWVRCTDLKCDTNINKTKTLKHRSKLQNLTVVN